MYDKMNNIRKLMTLKIFLIKSQIQWSDNKDIYSDSMKLHKIIDKIEDLLGKTSETMICKQRHLEYNWNGKWRYFLIELKTFF